MTRRQPSRVPIPARASARRARLRILAVAGSAAALVLTAAPGAADGSHDRRVRTRPIAGPIVGGIAANNGYYAYGPYAAPGPAAWGPLPWSSLYGPAVPPAPGCFLQRQRVWTEYGWRWRTAPICY